MSDIYPENRTWLLPSQEPLICPNGPSEENLDVAGPVALVSCHLFVSGNAVMRGSEEDAIVDVDLFSDTVVA